MIKNQEAESKGKYTDKNSQCLSQFPPQSEVLNLKPND